MRPKGGEQGRAAGGGARARGVCCSLFLVVSSENFVYREQLRRSNSRKHKGLFVSHTFFRRLISIPGIDILAVLKINFSSGFQHRGIKRPKIFKVKFKRFRHVFSALCSSLSCSDEVSGAGDPSAVPAVSSGSSNSSLTTR